jgi:transposase-like protein
MSKNRRNFTARFKADLVLEVLKGEKELNEIAAENNIQPNLLRNWKKEFEENAAAVFDNRKDGWMEKKLKEEKKAKEEYAKKVGQLTMQIDWLEKKSAEILGPDYESQFGPKPFDD